MAPIRVVPINFETYVGYRSDVTKLPNLILTVDRYKEDQHAVIDTWAAISSTGVAVEVLRRSAAAAISSSATNWEWFRSEWHKKAIARDATQYRQALLGKVRQILEQDGESGRLLLKTLDAEGIAIEVHLTQYPTIITINKLIDPSDGNVSFRSKSDSDRKASSHLTPRYAAGPLSLTRDDWLVIDVMLGVRNMLAHSSKRSVDAMNDALAACVATGNDEVKSLGRVTNRVTRSGIGAYLLADYRGVRRVERICSHMLQLEAKFRV
jgi:hypothetical protein